MKPGQQAIDREYYKHATTEQADGKKILSNYNRFQSGYDKHHNENVHKGDYKVPAKSQNNMSK
jgi:hypothetical protein